MNYAITNLHKALQNICWQTPYSFNTTVPPWMCFYTRLDSELKVYSTRNAVSSFVSYVFRFAERLPFCCTKLQTIAIPSLKATTAKPSSVANARIQRRRKSPKDPIKITFANSTKRKTSELVSFHSLNRAISSPRSRFFSRRLEFLSFGISDFPGKETTFILHFYLTMLLLLN